MTDDDIACDRAIVEAVRQPGFDLSELLFVRWSTALDEIERLLAEVEALREVARAVRHQRCLLPWEHGSIVEVLPDDPTCRNKQDRPARNWCWVCVTLAKLDAACQEELT